MQLTKNNKRNLKRINKNDHNFKPHMMTEVGQLFYFLEVLLYFVEIQLVVLISAI